ncbi:MAG: cystathionine gamma-lyase [Candidatus Entotheonella factor]|uniref:Cystathionine gamma-lyase n=1 Tax=Entotheonella factor TaxID=1429438 RepID=W4LIH1_ENTF1|nr:PLP-dependent aspartate aminotransferase family protein [Candidatus Entotheonella palauensis]ETW97510.1 MAG: cystathionine gamma-lyase [Candidatus Entotheonella factor]
MTQDRTSKSDRYRMQTRLIHGNRENKRWDFDHHLVPPMSASSAYRLGSVSRGAQGFEAFAADEMPGQEGTPIYIYDRLEEPTRGMLEDHLAEAEAGEMAVCFVTGMAAISAAIGVTAQAGDEIVSHHTVYGCTYSLFTTWLPRMGITVRFVDLNDAEQVANAITDQTRVIYGETPVNPTLDLIDIAQVHDWVKRINASRSPENQVVWIVDNTFATPYCQRPLTLGADLVVQSLTKDVGGFGTDMGGAVIGRQAYHQPLLLYRKDFGGVLPPKSAWPILVYGLPTLPTRMVNQEKTAVRVAAFLDRHPKVRYVSYPGLATFPQYDLARRQMVSPDGKFAPGGVLYFVLQGDEHTAAKAAEHFVDAIARDAYSITLAVSLGQIRTLIEEPYSMTHAALPAEVKRERGLAPGGIRLSIGLEDWEDIIADLDAAFQCI